MKLAKPALDVGLYTNELDAMLAFWQEQVGVPYQELLKVGGGVHQHRHGIGDSVLKINHQRAALRANEPTGLTCLEIFTPAVDASIDLIDPDGNDVRLSPPDGDHNLRLHIQANNIEQTLAFYQETLGLPAVGDKGVAAGASLLEFTPGSVAPFERVALGYRYMTVQVYDVVEEHARILAAGGHEGMAPVRLGDVAYISFVLDPDGNWIEISQRKSITGSLD